MLLVCVDAVYEHRRQRIHRGQESGGVVKQTYRGGGEDSLLGPNVIRIDVVQVANQLHGVTDHTLYDRFIEFGPIVRCVGDVDRS